jgi:PIN domain nuclease of toxin-antitoxin system
LNYLIDTQIIIWLFIDSGKLSSKILDILKDPENNIFVSVAPFWEIAIKISIKKLILPVNLDQLIEETLSNDIVIKNIDLNHILAVSELPYHHGDPFDRIIIAQAMVDNLTIISTDTSFKKYSLVSIW